MRLKAVAIVALTLAGAATVNAEVRLVVRADGSKAIYNIVGSGSSRGRGRSASTDYGWLAKQRNRSSQYDEIIHKHSRAYSVDPILVKAVIQVESNFVNTCVSHKGASGLMQLMPETARRFKVGKILDPEQNIRGGIAYLSFLLSYFSGDLPRALAAYNAGENAVLRHGGIPPFAETQEYVRRALTVYYGRPYGGSLGFAGSGHGVLRGGYMKKTPNARPTLVASAVLPARSTRASNLR
jgi:soluble lytic murein transglycosylase-like protein